MWDSPITVDGVPVIRPDGQTLYVPKAEAFAMRWAELVAPLLEDLSPSRLFAVVGLATVFWGGVEWLKWNRQREHERRETRRQRRLIRKGAKKMVAPNP